jgi:hypothetical protein
MPGNPLVRFSYATAFAGNPKVSFGLRIGSAKEERRPHRRKEKHRESKCRSSDPRHRIHLGQRKSVGTRRRIRAFAYPMRLSVVRDLHI